MRNYLKFCTVVHRQHPGFNGMGGAPNHRAFCPQTSRFAFLDREEGCHQLCGFRFLARKCKNRPLPPGGRRGQSRQKTEMKISPPQGFCGIDRWLPPHSAPPETPECWWGPAPSWAAWKRAESCLLSGAPPI